MKRIIGLIALAALLVIQFFQIDRTNPKIDLNKDFFISQKSSNNMMTTLKGACYDCHSYETKYPWYTYINPIGLWIKGHAVEGREHLNFSEWGSYPINKRNHKLEEMAEVVEETRMPLTPYLLGHKDARISKKQRTEMASWFRSQVK